MDSGTPGGKVQVILAWLEKKCLSKSTTTADGCARVFDGYYCWPETKSGQLAVQPCNNDFLISVNKIGLTTKQCTQNGTWYVKATTRRHWTNLTQCGRIFVIDHEATNQANETVEMCNKWCPVIKDASYLGYALSVVALIVALVIFITIKRLHCERNKLHVNLFFSYIMRAFMYFLKNALFLDGLAMFNDISYENGHTKINYTWTCKVFISIQCYFILANFIFMLMEGLYLHNLIFLNLFSECHGTNIYCLLGWITPIFFLIPWIILRMIFEDTLCWNNQDKSYIGLLIDVPIGLTIVVNFILFTIIVRVLVLKMHFTSTFIQQKKIKYRKLLKSTMILIPLYGIPYTLSLILSFYSHQSKNLEIVWLFFDQTFTSFQGLFAALVYCLLNSDVRNEVQRKYSAMLDRTNKEFRRSRTISSNTQQFSLQNNDDALENLKLFGIVDDDTVKKGSNSNTGT